MFQLDCPLLLRHDTIYTTHHYFTILPHYLLFMFFAPSLGNSNYIAPPFSILVVLLRPSMNQEE